MKTFTLIIDLIFTFIVCFFLGLVIYNYYFEHNLTISLSILTALTLCFVYASASKKKRAKNKLSNHEKLAFEQAITQLCLYTESEQCLLFESALEAKEYKTEKRKNALYVKGKNAVIFPLFNFDGVTKTDIVRIFNTIKSKEVAYILSRELLPEIKAFADRFNGKIIAVSEKQVYHFLKQTNTLPCCKFDFKPKRALTIAAFKNVLTKPRAKNLLVFGLIFLLSSCFVPIKTYYIICGSIFLILSLFARLFGKEKTYTT